VRERLCERRQVLDLPPPLAQPLGRRTALRPRLGVGRALGVDDTVARDELALLELLVEDVGDVAPAVDARLGKDVERRRRRRLLEVREEREVAGDEVVDLPGTRVSYLCGFETLDRCVYSRGCCSRCGLVHG